MAQIEKHTGGAHGSEGSSGYHIHLAHSSGRTKLVHDVRHLFSRYDVSAPVANTFVDFR